mmetsp:Transcript_38424/g.113984  ORF Transcript_38424/g.113984 Transcript_38424/m.113984 type:complete len:510 (-) Transcript_38424:2176-3705(-)
MHENDLTECMASAGASTLDSAFAIRVHWFCSFTLEGMTGEYACPLMPCMRAPVSCVASQLSCSVCGQYVTDAQDSMCYECVLRTSEMRASLCLTCIGGPNMDVCYGCVEATYEPSSVCTAINQTIVYSPPPPPLPPPDMGIEPPPSPPPPLPPAPPSYCLNTLESCNTMLGTSVCNSCKSLSGDKLLACMQCLCDGGDGNSCSKCATARNYKGCMRCVATVRSDPVRKISCSMCSISAREDDDRCFECVADAPQTRVSRCMTCQGLGEPDGCYGCVMFEPDTNPAQCSSRTGDVQIPPSPPPFPPPFPPPIIPYRPLKALPIVLPDLCYDLTTCLAVSALRRLPAGASCIRRVSVHRMLHGPCILLASWNAFGYLLLNNYGHFVALLCSALCTDQVQVELHSLHEKKAGGARAVLLVRMHGRASQHVHDVPGVGQPIGLHGLRGHGWRQLDAARELRQLCGDVGRHVRLMLRLCAASASGPRERLLNVQRPQRPRKRGRLPCVCRPRVR